MKFIVEEINSLENMFAFCYKDKKYIKENEFFYEIENTEKIKYELSEGVIDYPPTRKLSKKEVEEIYNEFTKEKMNKLKVLSQLLKTN